VKVHYELEAERKGNSIGSTAATPEILNHVTWIRETGEE